MDIAGLLVELRERPLLFVNLMVDGLRIHYNAINRKIPAILGGAHFVYVFLCIIHSTLTEYVYDSN